MNEKTIALCNQRISHAALTRFIVQELSLSSFLRRFTTSLRLSVRFDVCSLYGVTRCRCQRTLSDEWIFVRLFWIKHQFCTKICWENLPPSTVLTYAFRRPENYWNIQRRISTECLLHLNACTNKCCLQTLTYHLQPLYGVFDATTNTPSVYLFNWKSSSNNGLLHAASDDD